MLLKPKILYIDNEHENMDLAKIIFEEENFTIETCSHLHDALEKLRWKSFDLIITDLRSSEGSGQEIFNTIRTEGCFQGKMILVTGNIENVESLNQNKDEIVLFKPIKLQELVLQVKNLFFIT